MQVYNNGEPYPMQANGRPADGSYKRSDYHEQHVPAAANPYGGYVPHARRQPFALAWILEVVALAIGLGAVLGIYGVLDKYDNSRLPSFPYRINLNTIVSLLTQVFTVSIGYTVAAVIGQAKWNWFSPNAAGNARPRPLSDFAMFEGATHSPLGAIKLLLMRPAMLLSSAAAAASVLVLTLPIVGAFTQQLVKYDQRPVVVSSSNASAMPSVPRANYYDAFDPSFTLGLKLVDLPFKGGVYNAVYNNHSPDKFAVAASCTTGNCTWPDYATLAMCSQCVDSSADVTITCKGDGAQYCSYYLPGSDVLGYWTEGEYVLINATNFNSSAGAAGACRLPHAFTCSVYMCVQTLRDVMVNGNLTETVVSTFPNASTPDAAAKISIDGMNALRNLTMIPGPEDGGVFAGASAGAAYQVREEAWQAIFSSLFFYTALNGTGTGSANEESFTSDAMQVIYDAYYSEFYNNGTLGTPNGNGSAVGAFMKNYATSMTNVLRTDTQSTGATFANGTAYSSETFVSVTWDWIALPAAVWAAAFLLLVLVMWQTARAQAHCFKTESLPALFIDLGAAHLPVNGHVAPDTTEEMDKIAKQTNVTLRRGGSGQLLLA